MTTRSQFAATLANTLVAEGFRDTTPMVREIIDEWLAGSRGALLPYGLIGMLAGHHLNELEAGGPGKIAKLPKR